MKKWIIGLIVLVVIVLGVLIFCLPNKETNKLPDTFNLILKKSGCSSGGSCSDINAILGFENKILVFADVNESGSSNAYLNNGILQTNYKNICNYYSGQWIKTNDPQEAILSDNNGNTHYLNLNNPDASLLIQDYNLAEYWRIESLFDCASTISDVNTFESIMNLVDMNAPQLVSENDSPIGRWEWNYKIIFR